MAAIDSIVNRSRYLAAKNRRKLVTTADVQQAMKQSVIPSDSALNEALAAASPRGKRRTVSGPVQPPLTIAERPFTAGEESSRESATDARAAREFSDGRKVGLVHTESMAGLAVD